MTHSGANSDLSTARHDVWATGTRYEPYVGRWSRLVAQDFLAWLDVPAGGAWLDVGCGTGALSDSILAYASPRDVTGIDPSEGFVAYAQDHVRDSRAHFLVADALSLPFEAGSIDAVVSGLVLNFVPAPLEALAEMARVTRLGGAVGAYVWDYAGRMEFMRCFWDAAVALDPAALEFDEGRRFSLCRPGPLADLFGEAGLKNVEVRAIDIPTHFEDFDDFWLPFLGGQGSAPGYAMSLDETHRARLREHLRSTLPYQTDGSIHLIARAWEARGRRSR